MSMFLNVNLIALLAHDFKAGESEAVYSLSLALPLTFSM